MNADWRNGEFGKAFLSFVKTLLTFVIFPLSIYALSIGIMDVAAANGTAFLSPEMMEQIRPIYKETIERAVMFSIPLLIIAIPMGFYASGNAAKIPFRVAFAAYIAIWIWIITEGGMFFVSVSEMTFGSFTVSSVEIVLDLTLLIYISIVVCIAKAFLAFSEYGSYREKYLEELEEKGKKKDKGTSEETA